MSAAHSIDAAVRETHANTRRLRAQLRVPERWEAVPLVVIDLNVIQGLPRGAGLPGGCEFLIPDAALHDMAGKFDPGASGSISADAAATKFGRVLEREAHRFWVGHYWDQLSRAHTSTLIPMRLEQAVNIELSSVLHRSRVAAQDARSFLEELARSNSHAEWERDRALFVASCVDFARGVAGRPDIANDPSRPRTGKGSWLRQPHILSVQVPRVNSRYAETHWQALVARAPDAMPAARWILLHWWCHLELADNPTMRSKKLESLWDDINYAFLASYSGHLWTSDGQLKRLIHDVFPDVVVHDPASIEALGAMSRERS